MADDNNDKDSEHSFPEGYEHIAEMAGVAAIQMRQIDQMIKDIPKEDIKRTSYRLQFNPTGLAKAEQQWRKQLDRAELEQQKKEVETNLNKRVEREIKTLELDKETALEIRLAVTDTIHPNPFKGQTKEKMEMMRGMEKDPQHSQDYMRQLLRDFRQQSPREPSGNVSKGKGQDKD